MRKRRQIIKQFSPGLTMTSVLLSRYPALGRDPADYGMTAYLRTKLENHTWPPLRAQLIEALNETA